MAWLTGALTFLHVLFAIAWFGGSLTVSFLVVPAAGRLDEADQSRWWAAFAAGSTRYFASVAGATILLGIILGVANGVLALLGTPYGVTWIAALVLGVALAVWGARLTGPSVLRIAQAASADRAAVVASAQTVGRIELAGFAVLLATMVAMRLGY